MAIVFSNNANTVLASSVSTSATSISVVDGSVFPALSGSNYTYVTFEDAQGNVEIIKVTGRSGNTLTVVRAQDNTSARAFTAGDKCELRLTAAGLNEVATQADTDTTYTVGDGGLTQKNFTTTLKTKLDGVAESANNYVLPFTNNSANWNTAYGWGNHALSGYATESYVGTQVSNLVDSSPATLNTLNELAAALGDDANFSTTVTNSIATKLPLAGGTMTGALTIEAGSGSTTPLVIGSSSSTNYTVQRWVTNLGSSDAYIIAYGGFNTNNGGNFAVKNIRYGGEIFFELDNSVQPLRLTSTGATFAGEITANGGIALGDGDRATFGTSDDLVVYHDGTHSYVKNTTGNLYLQDDSYVEIGSPSGEVYIGAVKDGAVNLRFDNASKLATTASGIDVLGVVTADGLTVDGGSSSPNHLLTGARAGTLVSIDNESTSTSYGLLTNTASVSANSYPLWVTSNDVNRLTVGGNGDISFYNTAGDSQSLFWDASAKSLGIGISSPTATLDVRRADASGKIAEFHQSAGFGLEFGSSQAQSYIEAGSNQTLLITVPSDMTIDSGGDINLDAGGAEIKLKSGGTQFGDIYTSSSHFYIQSSISDKDLKFEVNDGGSIVTALTLDGSAAGSAIFNSSVASDTFKNASGNLNILSTSSILIKFDSDGNQTNREFNIQSNSGDQLLKITETGAATFASTIAATGGNSTNWNAAYGWGNHALSGYATQSYVGTQISNLVDSSPATLNTLNELAAALGDDANFSTTVTNSIATKLPLAGGTMTGTLAMGANAITGTGTISSGAITSTGKVQGNSLKAHVGTDDGSQLNLFANASGHCFIAGHTLSFNVGSNNARATKLYIDSVGNSVFSGTISSGAITSGNITISTDSIARSINDTFTLNGRTQPHYGFNLAPVANSPIGMSGYYGIAFATVGVERLRISNTGLISITNAVLQMSGSTVIDASRNLTNIGTLNGGTAWRSNNDGSGSGLDADLFDGYNSAVFLKSPSNVSGWQNSNANFSVRGGDSSNVGLHMEQSNGVFGFQLYSAGGTYGFLDAEWGGWDIQKARNGNFSVDEGAGLQRVWNAGNDSSGSGLDADLLDGQQGSYYANESARKSVPSSGNYQIVNSTAPSALGSGYLRHDFLNSSGPPGSAYRSVLSISSYTSGSQWTQLSFNYNQGINTPIYFRQNQYNGSTWSSWHQLWDSANDGSGSGLDADLLDGQHGSYYQPASTAITSANIGSQSVSSADNIDGRGFVNTGSNNGTNADTINSNGISYYTSGVTNYSGNATDGALYSQFYSTSWQHQIAGDYRSGQIAIRGKNSGTWQSWIKVWSANNDGSGSGLDADLLDGNQASFFAPLTNPTFAGTLVSPVIRARKSQTQGSYTTAALWTESFSSTSTGIAFHISGNVGKMLDMRTNGHLYWENGRVWSATSDGSGSGLDADLLDGQHGSYYYPASNPNGYTNDQTAAQLLAAIKTVDVNGSAGLNAGRLNEIEATSFVNGDGIYKSSSTSTFHNNVSGFHFYSEATNAPTAEWYNWITARANSWGDSGEYSFQLAHSFWSADGFYVRRTQAGTENSWNKVWTAASDGSGSGLDADLLDGNNSSYYYPASNPSGYQTAAQVTAATTAATVHKSDYVTGSAFATTNSVSSVLEYQQASGQSDTKLAPDTNWHNSIRMGHGNPYSYYSNTIAIRMTGSGVGDLYTQTIGSGTANGWRKHWSNANDGSGSGLDADLLDGLQASAFLGNGGGTMTGLLAGRVCTTTTVAAANDGGSFSVRGDASKPAVVSFHRAGAYAVNFGLSTANKMELGGWSASSIKHTWDFAGNYTAVGNITAYSDIRVKTNIEVIPKALDKVCQLSGYTFDRTDFVPDAETGVMPETRQTGVIAQEVLKVLPEAVSEMDDGKLTVAYGNMVGLLIESIKELKTEIEELKAQIGE